MTPMFTLFPRRWSHWLLFLIGPLFLATYFGLLSWEPVEERVGGLGVRQQWSVAAVVPAGF